MVGPHEFAALAACYFLLYAALVCIAHFSLGVEYRPNAEEVIFVIHRRYMAERAGLNGSPPVGEAEFWLGEMLLFFLAPIFLAALVLLWAVYQMLLWVMWAISD